MPARVIFNFNEVINKKTNEIDLPDYWWRVEEEIERLLKIDIIKTIRVKVYKDKTVKVLVDK